MSAIVKQVLPVVEPDPDVPNVPIYRLSVEQYHQMIQAGILTADDPVELLEGWLVKKMGKNPPHRLADWLVRSALEHVTPTGWYVDAQEPVTTRESEPEPDVQVVRGKPRQYLKRHPGPTDLAMAIEVSDSSLGRDRGIKKRLYARARVPVYWIVNLVENQIEVYSNPSGPTKRPTYRKYQVYRPGDQIPVVLDGKEVGRLNVSDLLP